MSPSLFLNYRSADTASLAVLMERELCAIFGEGTVFRDDSSIPPSEDFRKYLWRRLHGCDAMLVLIGAHWWNPAMPGGNAPVMDPDDFVRREIEAALEWGIKVVPVLTDRVGRLAGRAFPDSLESLPFLQYRTIRERSAVNDIQTLARDLSQVVGLSPVGPTHSANGGSVVDTNHGIVQIGNENTARQWGHRG